MLLTILPRWFGSAATLEFLFREMYLSPRPCAHITVAVCFLKAGTTNGAGPAIVTFIL